MIVTIHPCVHNVQGHCPECALILEVGPPTWEFYHEQAALAVAIKEKRPISLPLRAREALWRQWHIEQGHITPREVRLDLPAVDVGPHRYLNCAICLRATGTDPMDYDAKN